MNGQGRDSLLGIQLYSSRVVLKTISTPDPNAELWVFDPDGCLVVPKQDNGNFVWELPDGAVAFAIVDEKVRVCHKERGRKLTNEQCECIKWLLSFLGLYVRVRTFGINLQSSQAPIRLEQALGLEN